MIWTGLVVVGAAASAPLIILIVALITGDFDFSRTHPERRDVYRRWRHG